MSAASPTAFVGLRLARGSRRLRYTLAALGLIAAETNAHAAPTATVRLAVPVAMSTYGHPFNADDGSSTRLALFDGLTALTREGKLEPALAQRWRMTSPTTWIFELRPGTVFHNGRPMTADAAVAAINYVLGDPTLFAYRDVVNVAGARALSPTELKVTTRTPDPILPNRLAGVMIPEPEAFRALGIGGFTRAPVGTGPFRPRQWDRGTGRATLIAEPSSWRASKSVGTIEMNMLTDVTTRMQALLSDQTDIAVNLEPDHVDVLQKEGLTTHVLPAPHVLVIALRNIGEAAEPLKDARVRRALNLAVNKQQMLDGVLGGRGALASQITTVGVPGFDPTLAPYPYDPATARKLLSEAGYGKGFDLDVGVFSGQVPGDTAMFQLMKQDLAAVGVNVTLRALSMAEFMQRVGTGEWSGADALPTALSSARFGDASQAIEFLSCASPAKVFCAPELTKPIEAAATELDPAKRAAMMQGVVRALHDVAPVLLLTQYVSFTGTSKRVKTYLTRANGVRFEAIEVVP